MTITLFPMRLSEAAITGRTARRADQTPHPHGRVSPLVSPPDGQLVTVTVATRDGRVTELIRNGRSALRMGMKPRLATVARVHGQLALLVIHDAIKDGIVDSHEQAAILDHAEDWFTETVKTDEAGAIAHAFERGIEDNDYINERVIRYRCAVIDELPRPAA